MCPVDPPSWHVDPVSPEDDAKLRDLMRHRSEITGERATKQGVIRLAVRRMWRDDIEGGGNDGA